MTFAPMTETVALMTDNEIDELINELKAWVEQTGVKQATLARMLGINRQRLNDWFMGKTKPNLAAWLKIKSFLRSNRRSSTPRRKEKDGGER
jgi:predicted XRE-type DNA-binding protein